MTDQERAVLDAATTWSKNWHGWKDGPRTIQELIAAEDRLLAAVAALDHLRKAGQAS